MAQRTKNLGRAQVPYPHGEVAFLRDLEACVTAYETQPQDGDLGGLSPREAFNRAVTDRGWKRMDIDPHALLATFARDESRIARQGAFTYDGRRYTAPEIQALPAGSRLHLRVPIFSRFNEIPVLDPRGELLCMAQLDRPFDALDPAGAKESARRKQRARAAVRAARDDAPALDMRAEMAKLAAAAEPEAEPDSAGRIGLSDVMAEIGHELAKPRKQRKAEEDERGQILAERELRATERHLAKSKFKRTGTDG